jgi:hypothetical protein
MSVKVYLKAGLGNQLFMIFAGFSYALKHNKEFKIISYFNSAMCGKNYTYWNNILKYFENSLVDNPQSTIEESNKYNEPHFAYCPIPDELSNKEDTVLFGFFQSEKYFKEYYNIIAEKMQLSKQLLDIKTENINLFRKKTIAIHFRIGDYIHLQGNHPIKKPEYFIYALKSLDTELKTRGENIEDYDILYFSQKQDFQTVEEFIRIFKYIFNEKLNFVKVSDNIPDWKQLLLMANCNHFIIANSTFSWFAAYFCENIDKIVYYPKVWFGKNLQQTHDTKDLFPSGWKEINA